MSNQLRKIACLAAAFCLTAAYPIRVDYEDEESSLSDSYEQEPEQVPNHYEQEEHIEQPIIEKYFDHHTKHQESYDHHPKYAFSYGVKDTHTGDIKHHSEQREGGHVTGQYSLIEPDGTKRIVDYVADEHTGFHAIVHRVGLLTVEHCQ